MTISTGKRAEQVIPVINDRGRRSITFADSMFEYDRSQHPKKSSDDKRVFVGCYTEFLHGGFTKRTLARAVEFPMESLGAFGKECASLSKANAVGVGPRVLQILLTSPLDKAGQEIDDDVCWKAGDDGERVEELRKKLEELQKKLEQRAVLIEEDVGVNLDDAIFKCAPIPGDGGLAARPLSSLGTPERELENAKIKFDVFTQLFNLHANGMYHRDMRVANVCVKRYGEAPEDIRATLIDFELVGDMVEHGVSKTAKPYVKALFGRGNPEDPDELLKASAVELDLGYLAAFCYELESGIRVAAAGPDLLDGSRFPFFTNTGHGYLKVKSIGRSDLDDLAAAARLKKVSEENLGSNEAVELANSLIKHGGYLDRLDEEELRKEPLSYILLKRPKLVKYSYETYKKARIKDGKPVDYESFHEQPKDLQELNLDLFASYPSKLERLGYALAREGEVPAGGTRIDSWEKLLPGEFEEMSEDEHNRWWAMKEKQGWRPWKAEFPGEVFDEAKKAQYDAEKRNKDMVPYGELEERTKEYDRKNVRLMWKFLHYIELVIYRP